MLYFILLLLGASVGCLAYWYIPSSLSRYAKFQKTRFDKFGKHLDEMFVFSERPRLLRIYTITPLSLGSLGFIFFRSPIGLIAGVALGLFLPPIVIKQMGALRKNKFQGQLVDALMLLSGSLKAGMSLNQAFEALVEEMPPPVCDEFALVIRENKMGVELLECLAHLKRRIPIDDLDLIVTAIAIVRETGGDLTEVFENLVSTIREKQKLQNRVKALTIQGRLQGYIMMLLPIGFSVFMYSTTPQNFQIMLNDQLGRTLLVWAVISELIGAILIRKFSRVEV